MAEFVLTASDAGAATDSSSRVLSLPRTAVNWGLFPGSEVLPGAEQYPGQPFSDAVATTDSSRGARLSFSRTPNDAIAATDVTSQLSGFARSPKEVAPVSDLAIDISGLVVRLLLEEAQAGDRGHPSISLHESAFDVVTAIDSVYRTTSISKGAFDGLMMTDFNYWFVSKTMGYLIWPERNDDVPQNHPVFTHVKELPISPINLLRVFEGRIFTRTEGPDAFAFQLTAYPWSVNKPRQTTNMSQGLEPPLNPFASSG
jgi:hypothetical protein